MVSTRSYVQNPPWVTQLLANAYESLEERIRPDWLPKLTSVKASTLRGSKQVVMKAEMKEYGCGAFGCVLPTLDDSVVLKLTSDDTEAQFAREIAGTLVAPICVRYYDVLETNQEFEGNKVWLLWRDSANHVGDLHALGDMQGDVAKHLVNEQHMAASFVLTKIWSKRARGRGTNKEVAAHLKIWRRRVEDIVRQAAKPVADLFDGVLQVFDEQGIFIGDVHSGNVGMVTQDGVQRWVITDPGHVVVFTDPGSRY